MAIASLPAAETIIPTGALPILTGLSTAEQVVMMKKSTMIAKIPLPVLCFILNQNP
jgi:hypothetical protein